MRLAQFTTLTALALAGCLLQPFVGPAVGEVDVAATLVGRWEGTAEVPSPQYLPTRVLLIKNVRQDATAQGIAKWKADGSYGITADKLSRIDLAITVVEPTVAVEFTTPLALHGAAEAREAERARGHHFRLRRRARLSDTPGPARVTAHREGQDGPADPARRHRPAAPPARRRTCGWPRGRVDALPDRRHAAPLSFRVRPAVSFQA